jgi:hypothetical protein
MKLLTHVHAVIAIWEQTVIASTEKKFELAMKYKENGLNTCTVG